MDIQYDMRGKTCLVTGATDGIGEITARTLAQYGATVIVVGRDPKRSATTVERIHRQTGNDAVEFIPADLSSLAEIRRLAQQFKDQHPRLDVLVNNAGALFIRRRRSVDGFEKTFALNHLGYFLLTNLLLDTIRSSAPARIVNVSSAAHWRATLDLDDLQNERTYSSMQAYGQSKLANILFTYELARRLEGTGVTVNALHPGFVATYFGVGRNPVGRLFKRVVNLWAISAEDGAQTSIYLAASPDVEGVTGKYFVNKKPVRSSKASYDQLAARRLWQESARLTGLAP